MKLRLIATLLLAAGVAYGADAPITSLSDLGNNLASGDWFCLVDISDTTQSAQGTTKKINASNVVNDTAFANTWDTISSVSPSKNAVYDYLHIMAPADNGKVGQLNTAAAGFVPTNSSGVIGTARVITAGTATSVTNGDGSAGNPTVNFDPTGLTGNRTWANGSNASLTWTWDLSGTDPVLTIGSGVLNVTTGSLQVGGVDVLTLSGTQVLTNKTFDASATGNVLKFKSLPQFTSPLRVDGTNCTIGTTVTTLGYGLANFSNSAAAASNWAEWRIIVPADWDSSVDPTVKISTNLTGADTGTQRYVFSVADIASSATGTLGTAINVDQAADAAGASGDVENTGPVTLTGWGAACTAGHLMVIRVARDGTASPQDASTVNSILIAVELSYAASQ